MTDVQNTLYFMQLLVVCCQWNHIRLHYPYGAYPSGMVTYMHDSWNVTMIVLLICMNPMHECRWMLFYWCMWCGVCSSSIELAERGSSRQIKLLMRQCFWHGKLLKSLCRFQISWLPCTTKWYLYDSSLAFLHVLNYQLAIHWLASHAIPWPVSLHWHLNGSNLSTIMLKHGSWDFG